MELAGGHQTEPELLATQHAVQLTAPLHGQDRPGGTGGGSAQCTGHQFLGVHLAGGEQVQQEERVRVDDRRLHARPARVRQAVGPDGRLGRTVDRLDDQGGVQVEPAEAPTGRHHERSTVLCEAERLRTLRHRAHPRRLSLYH